MVLLVGVLVGGLIVFRFGTTRKDLSLSCSLSCCCLFHLHCVFWPQSVSSEGFWRSEAGTLKREILDATPIPPPPLHEYIYTLLPQPPTSLYSPICFFFNVSLVSPALRLMVFLLVLQVSFLPVSIHPSLSVLLSFFFFFLLCSKPAASNICAVQARVSDMSSQRRHRRSLQPDPILVLHAMK